MVHPGVVAFCVSPKTSRKLPLALTKGIDRCRAPPSRASFVVILSLEGLSPEGQSQPMLSRCVSVRRTPVLLRQLPLIETTAIDADRNERIELGVDYGLTVSCYQADDAGRACGVCDSCRPCSEGFRTANVPAPTRYC
jgi:hypothetical protein